MDHEKLYERIRKLLNLAESSNENEAKLAAARAQEILVKYNLDFQEMEKKISDYCTEMLREDYSLKTGESLVLAILEKCFFVNPIIKCEKRVVVNGKVKHPKKFVLVGSKANVAVAKYVYAFLMREFNDLWKQYKKETGVPDKMRMSYLHGLRKGIIDQLTAARKKVEHEQGLVIVEDHGLQAYMRQMFPRIQSQGTQRVGLNSDVASAGQQAGSNIRIRSGITENRGNSQLFLR